VNHSHSSTSRQNPFCAGRLRPGTVPFLFPAGQSAEQLADRLEQCGWWGQIVGPHGSGKSTLLATLLPAIERRGRSALVVELHDGQRRLPAGCRQALAGCLPGLLAIDGYEQLAAWNQFRLKRSCRRRGLGLLVTSHQPVGLPDLFETTVDLPLAWQVVEELQQSYQPLIERRDVAERLPRHGTNLREVLFDLFDTYEARFRGHNPES
jgi:hypothetical protein